MAMTVRTAIGFRWRPTGLDGHVEDFVRICADGEAQLALIANGYECGFSSCWPPASRLILDLFVAAWTATTGAVEDRLAAAFAQARARFLAAAPALAAADADFPDDVPGAVLLAVACHGTTMHAAWIGADTAVIVRGLAVIARTTPHTLRERFEREHPDRWPDFARVPNVLLRTIGPGAPDQELPAIATFEITAGDTVILLSKPSVHGKSLLGRDVAAAAFALPTPTVLVEKLAHLCFRDEAAPYAAVAVLRFDADRQAEPARDHGRACSA